MYRIRFHGRGGQGVKTASHILGNALFIEGFEVQDAPRYGAERRGAPIFAYVRASSEPIYERGIIQEPDLVVVADDTLVTVPTAGVLNGVTSNTVVLINSSEEAALWKQRLNWSGRVFSLPTAAGHSGELRRVGTICAGAAARLLGVVSRDALEQAIREELSRLNEDVIEENVERALMAYDHFAAETDTVSEGLETSASDYQPPAWIEVPFEPARTSAPDIHGAANSVQVETGLWRTIQPVIDYERCNGCWWVCSTLCPDGTILVEDGRPRIDYDHCKGCMICLAVCPPSAIFSRPEGTVPFETVVPSEQRT